MILKSKFNVGDEVHKIKGYAFPGKVVAVYLTLSEEIRYVVECTSPDCKGIQHIYNEEQLAPGRKYVTRDVERDI